MGVWRTGAWPRRALVLGVALLSAGACLAAGGERLPDVMAALRRDGEGRGVERLRAAMRRELALARAANDLREQALALLYLASDARGEAELTGDEDPVRLLVQARELWEKQLTLRDMNLAWEDPAERTSWLLWSPERDPVDWGRYEDVLEQLARKLEARGAFVEALEAQERLLAVRAHRLAPGHLSIGRLQLTRAGLLARTGRTADAQAALDEARAIIEVSGVSGDVQDLETRAAEVRRVPITRAAPERPARLARFLAWLSGTDRAASAPPPRPRGKRELLHFGHGSWVDHLTWSPRGDLIASHATGLKEGVAIWSATEERRVRLLPLGATVVDGLAFVGDGRQLFVLTWGGVRRFALPGGEELAPIPPPCPGSSCSSRTLAVSADGARVAVAYGMGEQEGRVQVFEASTGALLGSWRACDGDVVSLAFGADGSLCVGGTKGPVRRFSVPDGRPLSTWGEPERNLQLVALSPRGDLAVVRPQGGAPTFLSVPDGTLRARLPSALDRFVHMAFTPDGKRLVAACGDWRVRVIDIATARVDLELRGHGEAVSAAVPSPDGTRAATAGHDGRIIVWDLR